MSLDSFSEGSPLGEPFSYFSLIPVSYSAHKEDSAFFPGNELQATIGIDIDAPNPPS
jgi:hypothetical protein